MTKWLVVSTQSITDEQEKAFIEYVRSKHMSWWHWTPNFWLVTGSDPPSCGEIRDKLHELAPGQHTIVIEVTPVTWAGFGPSSDKRNMFAWFDRNWKRPQQ